MRLLNALLITLATFTASGQPYTIRTVAGGGLLSLIQATPGGGGAGVAVDHTGNLFYGGSMNTAVWKLDASTGLLTRVAGNGMPGFGGDGGPAINAQMVPAGIALDVSGNLYIADAANNRVRKVSNGIITTVAGSGSFGFSGDNGPAASVQISSPAESRSILPATSILPTQTTTGFARLRTGSFPRRLEMARRSWAEITAPRPSRHLVLAPSRSTRRKISISPTSRIIEFER